MTPGPTNVTLAPEECDELRQAARRRGLRLKHIARAVGVDPHLLARYQCGERRVPATVLDAWQRVLGIRGN